MIKGPALCCLTRLHTRSLLSGLENIGPKAPRFVDSQLLSTPTNTGKEYKFTKRAIKTWVSLKRLA